MCALLAVRNIALDCSGMILMHEVTDAPVIMGISKPAGLKYLLIPPYYIAFPQEMYRGKTGKLSEIALTVLALGGIMETEFGRKAAEP